MARLFIYLDFDTIFNSRFYFLSEVKHQTHETGFPFNVEKNIKKASRGRSKETKIIRYKIYLLDTNYILAFCF